MMMGGVENRRPFPEAEQRVKQQQSVGRYLYLGVISSGGYGVVHKAWDQKSGEMVAMKEEFHGMSQSTMREISILKSLPRHPSIVEYKEEVVDKRGRVFVVMEYVEKDLQRWMRQPYSAGEVKSVMRQILEGVCFLHKHGVMHRDLKPSNILVDTKAAAAQIKLCDFGLSKQSSSGPHTPGVVTLWYRAPEVLIGDTAYSSAIDMWSVGCIMAELVLGHVLFPGRSEIHQLVCIQQLMGAPHLLRRSLTAALLSESGFDLLLALLAWNPCIRITAKQALNHAWFSHS